MRMSRFVFFFLCFFYSAYAADLLTPKEESLILHIQESISKAERGISKLKKRVLTIEGMSSPKVRHFLNNICSLENSCYLEVGCWKGSTWVAALFHNYLSVLDAIGIDNWSEFGGPRGEFLANCRTYLANYPRFRTYSYDAFTLDKSAIFQMPVTIYFYDGNHSEMSQELALTYYDEVLNDLFILIVDDWNFPPVAQGTREGIRKLGYQVLFEQALPADYNGDRAKWWNGLYVALIKKPT